MSTISNCLTIIFSAAGAVQLRESAASHQFGLGLLPEPVIIILWVEIVVGSHLATSVFLRVLCFLFSTSTKTNTSNSYSIFASTLSNELSALPCHVDKQITFVLFYF